MQPSLSQFDRLKAGLRTMRRRRVVRRLLILGLLLAAAYGLTRHHAKRFQAVRPGVFYRVGQPSELGLWYLVNVRGVRTVVSTQLYDIQLRRGLFDPGKPSGVREAGYVERLGARHVQWPMGEEACWPWPTPWQFDEFFRLMDDPANLPVALHCAGGRHRTGTYSALFRLEYDRWPVEKALAELYSFEYGPPVPILEHNLRTYLPRPRPSAQEWPSLLSLAAALPEPPPADYDALVLWLRTARGQASVELALDAYLADHSPFAAALAQRLVDDPSDRLAPAAVALAHARLELASQIPNPESQPEWAMSAALIADFGCPIDQSRLLALLEGDPRNATPTVRYDAIVAGVTNRYTPNRIPYLRPLLDDERRRLAGDRYRYCDTAVARLSSIIDRALVSPASSRPDWDAGRTLGREWFAANDQSLRLAQLTPPTGKNKVKQGEPAQEQDVRR